MIVAPGPSVELAAPSVAAECRICGGLGVAASHLAEERMFGLGGRFVYDECARCRSLTLRDVPTDLSVFYPDDYYSYITPAALSRVRRTALNVMHFRPGGRYLARTAPGRHRALARAGLTRRMRLLDVGGGNGQLVDELRASGHTGEAIVLDPFATRDCTAGGNPILRTTLADCTGEFDMVMFNHSLEHHPKPRRALSDAATRLADGGALIVRCPTLTSECWSRYGVDWVELDAPRHLTIPSQGGLIQMVTDAGLTVERHWRDGEAFQLWGSELYRRGVPYAGTDPRAHFSERQLRGFARETRKQNASGTAGRIALIARRA